MISIIRMYQFDYNLVENKIKSFKTFQLIPLIQKIKLLTKFNNRPNKFQNNNRNMINNCRNKNNQCEISNKNSKNKLKNFLKQ